MLYDLQSGVLLTRCLLDHWRALQQHAPTSHAASGVNGKRLLEDVLQMSDQACFKEATSGRLPSQIISDGWYPPLWMRVLR